MRILHFSTEDVSGGAGIAAHRLHSALRQAGHQSRMIVRRKTSDDDDVQQAPPPPPLSLWQYELSRLRKRLLESKQPLPVANYTFNFDLEPEIDASKMLDDLKQPPDIICLHWVNKLLNTRLIKALSDQSHSHVIWVIADQDPMTGGCHYSFDCEGYKNECGCCPQLDSRDRDDYSHVIWKRKEEYLSKIPVCFIAPTSWGVTRLGQSSLFRNHRVELIPYPIDTTIFRPIDQQIARNLLHLPLGKKVVFFGATYLEDRRKGMKHLLEALTQLGEMIDSGNQIKRDDLFLFVSGLNGKELMSQINLPGKYSGLLNGDLTLALAYQAADIFLCPSIEEAGPMMIPEAMLCGAPVVAFNTGGAPDLVKTMQTGYLAELADAEDFACGIYALLTADNLPAMRQAAREAALKSHAPSLVAQRHIDLYQNLIKS